MAEVPRIESLLARGNTADVYALGVDAVVKVPRSGVPDDWIRVEAEYAAAVYQAGLPTPMVLDVIDVERRPAIVFERIVGPSMLEVLRTNAASFEELARAMGSIQHDFHAVEAPTALPATADRVARKLVDAPFTTADRAEASRRLGGMSDGRSTCHGDVHPGNVLMSERGPMVIDWFDATRGPAVADFVRTSLIVRPLSSGRQSPHLLGVPADVLERFHRAYVAAVLERGTIDAMEALAWEPVLAMSRSTEPVEWSFDDLRALWEGRRRGATESRSGLAALLHDGSGRHFETSASNAE